MTGQPPRTITEPAACCDCLATQVRYWRGSSAQLRGPSPSEAPRTVSPTCAGVRHLSLFGDTHRRPANWATSEAWRGLHPS